MGEWDGARDLSSSSVIYVGPPSRRQSSSVAWGVRGRATWSGAEFALGIHKHSATIPTILTSKMYLALSDAARRDTSKSAAEKQQAK